VSKKINTAFIIKKMTTLKNGFKKLFNKNPKIGILGLNPHNSEFAINSKEVQTINPSIKKLKKNGFNIKCPFSADTMFIKNYKKFNVIVGMYHDQVLTPFKSLFHYDAINVTLGLKYIRVSPDHGPARDIVKKNKANHQSLLKCVKFINNLN
jgi:4-hydroxythreonine-4-phosphate dehydrogenase